MILFSRQHLTLSGMSGRGNIVTGLIVLLILFGAYAVNAQSGGTIVAIARVESESFPVITAYASVYDEKGPRSGLDQANFHILEEGKEIASSAVQITSEDSLETRLVLALDTSMADPTAFAKMKDASKGFIASLKPTDRLALMTYGDQATITVPLTDDKTALQKAVDGLTIRGSLTNFNQAAFDGLTALGVYPGRKAVILVTDSGDHYRKKTTDEIIAKSQSTGTPVYVIGFNQFRINQTDGKKITAASGGMLYLPNIPEDMSKSFQSIEKLLRQGNYKITYKSDLLADNLKHNLTVGVIYEDRLGEAKSGFTAMPAPVTVTVSGLSENARIGGLVRVGAQVKARTDIVAVEYWLVDKPLAERTNSPYTYEWDTSTLKPGNYQFSAKARDKAGNFGETKLNINIVAPITLEASASAGVVKSGEPVKISARIETLDAVERVELLVDGRLADSDTTLPFEFNLASQGYATGAHTLTVRVIDNAGRQKDSLLPLMIQPAPVVKKAPTITNYLILAGVPLLGLVLLAGLIVALILLMRWQKKRLNQIHHLRLSNLGNLFASYELVVEEKARALKFSFFHDNQLLPEVIKTIVVGRETIRSAPVEQTSSRAPTASSGAGSAGNTLRQAGGFIGRIGFFLGSLLPGSAGAAAQRASSTVYKAEMEIREAERMKGLVTRTSPAGMEASQPFAAAGRNEPAISEKLITRQMTVIQTPVIDPDSSILLDLKIQPVNAYQAGTYQFEITSQPSSQDQGAPARQQGSATMAGIHWMWRLLPYLGFLLLAGIILFLTTWWTITYWAANFA